jgi:exopolyphosphatase/guanosine-5'-triphosphate,3'-diphosphate pyrophosphatase
VEALGQATGLGVRALSAEEEAELGYVGALVAAGPQTYPVAVCDVGGGSTQLAVGSGPEPAWLRSVELGSLRLTERCLHSDPPTPRELAAARDEAAAVFDALTPPLPAVALATGGTARGLRRSGYRRLDGPTLERAVEELATLPVAARSKEARVEIHRARTLPAGAIILARVQALLQVRLEVASGGIREGVCFDLLESAAATAS